MLRQEGGMMICRILLLITLVHLPVVPLWAQTTSPSADLAKNPRMLLDKRFDSKSATLYGIRIGDDVAKVAQIAKQMTDMPEFYAMPDGSSFLIENGKVKSFNIRDRNLAALSISNPDDFQMRFGKADETERKDDGSRKWLWFDRGLTAQWYYLDGRAVWSVTVQ